MRAAPFVGIDRSTFGYISRRTILSNLSLTFATRQGYGGAYGLRVGARPRVLRLIGRPARGQQGQVLFDGQDVGQLRHGGSCSQLRRRMGMLFQFGALFTDLSVFENVAFPLREHTQLSEALIRDIVLMKLHAVGLRGARDLMPSADIGRHGAARGAGARDCARPRTHHVRRALCGPGPDLAGHGGPASSASSTTPWG